MRIPRIRRAALAAVLLTALAVPVTPVAAEPARSPATPEPTRTVLPGVSKQLEVRGPSGLSSRRLPAGTTHKLTLRHLGHDGALAPTAFTGIANLDGSLNEPVDVGTGEVTLALPAGRYVFASTLEVGEQTSVLVQPLLDLRADTTVAVDFRRTKPLAITVDDASVSSYFSALYFARRLADGSMLEFSAPGGPLEDVRAGQLGPDVPANELKSSVGTHWAVPGPRGDFADSPVTYHSMDTVDGRFVQGLQRVVRRSALARLVSTTYSTAADLVGVKSIAVLPPDHHSVWSKGLTRNRPGTVTEYVEAGREVSAGFQERTGGGEESVLVAELNWGSSRSFAAGSLHRTEWNRAVLGPGLPEGAAARYGDQLAVEVGLTDDAAGNNGWGMDQAAATRLYRDGVLVVETDRPGNLGREAIVEPGQAKYRLETEVIRAAGTRRSTVVKTAWTFRSDTTSESGEALPLWVARFAPGTGLANDVAAGRIVVPLTLTPQPGAKVGKPGVPVVETSADGGGSWRRATVVPVGGGRYQVGFTATVGTVGLRVTMTDSLGNSVEQSVADALGVR
ncbi:hypothetical protein FB561_3232 [Kribbella amoyensis]|uniref:Uncharacterized protein n=1 Tax=Kribbella amoyensis TaxID=996641 RepID=A0A561BT89_9ACTN|nr:hypothetical protein [Kribbella amoyensis]TWD82105.1 hypothetical protein FB561_3232 [Kribbella amoyensis]